jgi:hypothetical protein
MGAGCPAPNLAHCHGAPAADILKDALTTAWDMGSRPGTASDATTRSRALAADDEARGIGWNAAGGARGVLADGS